MIGSAGPARNTVTEGNYCKVKYTLKARQTTSMVWLTVLLKHLQNSHGHEKNKMFLENKMISLPTYPNF